MLRRRLLLHLLPLVAVLLATGVYATILFSRLAYRLDREVLEHYRSIAAAEAMSQALAGIEHELWVGSGTGGMNLNTLAGYQQRFQGNLAAQLANSSLQGEKELDRELADKYGSLCKLIASRPTMGGATSRRRISDLEVTPLLLEMKALLDKVRNLNQRAMLDTSERAGRATLGVTRLMAAGMVIALVIFAYASYQLARSVLKPIQMVIRATRELGEGNLKQPVPVVSRDELGELAIAFNKMAAQLQEYRQSTTEEIVRLHRAMETTLASFPDPIFVLNKAGVIELQNPAATDLLLGLKISSQLPAPLHEIAQRTLARGDNFLPHTFEAVVSYRLNGAEKFFLPRILTMRARDDALFGVAVVLYDVTRFRLLDAAKTHLVGTVSHELKTPLTSVRMVLHILLEKTVGGLNPKQEELLETARTDTERLLRILNDLLDLARLEEGAAELHREKVAPAELLQGVIEETADKAAAKKLEIVCGVDPDLPFVMVDRHLIGHVFANLLGNAIKHSAPGGEIRLGASRAEDHSVRFIVADDGPGIPEEYHQRIFDRFFRVPGQSKNGAGLGLSIVREIAVAHGGRISVKSAPGKGATFRLTLKTADGVR
jgi:two-component system, NtrC family, sensor histidine kinase KinB